jgi:hypothetical protein
MRLWVARSLRSPRCGGRLALVSTGVPPSARTTTGFAQRTVLSTFFSDVEQKARPLEERPSKQGMLERRDGVLFSALVPPTARPLGAGVVLLPLRRVRRASR